MVDRLWWLDHQMPEDDPSSRSTMSTSCSNTYEVEMIGGLVEYLVQSNEYNYGDITILTPYNDQLVLFTTRLQRKCALWLSEKDRENLLSQGLLDADDSALRKKIDLETRDMLRLATIDNFQGEESKVIILSLVRSNADGRAGFMKTLNRVNVACSRARNGFYIVGNASLMGTVPIWKKVIDLLREAGCMGPTFRTCCSRHRDKGMQIVHRPSQWTNLSPCPEPCSFKYPCGHICQLGPCHAEVLHERRPCPHPCEKQQEKCGHPCLKECGEPCGECLYQVATMKLACGHDVDLTCTEISKQSSKVDYICGAVVDLVTLQCGHEKGVICSEQNQVHECNEQCMKTLSCGHRCRQRCEICSTTGHHAPCKERCGRKRTDCSHACEAICHSNAECPPCKLPCERYCSHRSCSEPCSKICDPCVQRCDWQCEHQGQCSTICSLPCTRLPCSEPCSKRLACGHVCLSFCGETCPTRCIECEGTSLAFERQMTLPCGHQFNSKLLDMLFSLRKLYKMDEAGRITGFQPLSFFKNENSAVRCPTCQVPCPFVRRYSLHHQVQHLKDTVDRLYAKMSRKSNGFLDQVYKVRARLGDTFTEFKKAIRPGPLTGRRNEWEINERVNLVSGIEDTITRCRGKYANLSRSIVHD